MHLTIILVMSAGNLWQREFRETEVGRQFRALGSRHNRQTSERVDCDNQSESYECRCSAPQRLTCRTHHSPPDSDEFALNPLAPDLECRLRPILWKILKSGIRDLGCLVRRNSAENLASVFCMGH